MVYRIQPEKYLRANEAMRGARQVTVSEEMRRAYDEELGKRGILDIDEIRRMAAQGMLGSSRVFGAEIPYRGIVQS